MAIVLGPHQYGKAEVRVVAVDRSSPQHTLVDLNVSSSLRGDFAAAHTAGDNARVLCSHHQDGELCATKLLWTRVQGGVIRALQNTTLAELVAFTQRDAPLQLTHS